MGSPTRRRRNLALRFRSMGQQHLRLRVALASNWTPTSRPLSQPDKRHQTDTSARLRKLGPPSQSQPLPSQTTPPPNPSASPCQPSRHRRQPPRTKPSSRRHPRHPRRAPSLHNSRPLRQMGQRTLSGWVIRSLQQARASVVSWLIQH